MATKVTHITNWKTVHPMSGMHKTLCGKEAGRLLGVPMGVTVASNPHDATCQRCRKIRDGR